MNTNNKRKPTITTKNYDNICDFLIPVILTALIEVVKKLYNHVLDIENADGYILGEAFPFMRLVFFPICIFSYIILFVLVLYFNYWIKSKLFNTPNEEKYIKDSFLRLREFGFKRQESFITDFLSLISGSTYAEFLIKTHKSSIDLVVSTCFEFFKDSFSEQGNLVNEICFEVSFMSKSFVDDKITIVSSYNKNNRTPPSMRIRRSINPNIYDDTETGKIYKRYAANPSETLAIHIVEDCSAQNGFTHLYEGQEDIIKSMAILPILSPHNELLGTLVVCVNQANFFKNQERRFWNELLEIYSVELGYHYLALNNCISHNNSCLSEIRYNKLRKKKKAWFAELW